MIFMVPHRAAWFNHPLHRDALGYDGVVSLVFTGLFDNPSTNRGITGFYRFNKHNF